MTGQAGARCGISCSANRPSSPAMLDAAVERDIWPLRMSRIRGPWASVMSHLPTLAPCARPRTLARRHRLRGFFPLLRRTMRALRIAQKTRLRRAVAQRHRRPCAALSQRRAARPQRGLPVLRLCTADEPPAQYGVGISVNSHYRNANWVAVEGRDFLWRGALAPGERLTREAYERTQARGKGDGAVSTASNSTRNCSATSPPA